VALEIQVVEVGLAVVLVPQQLVIPVVLVVSLVVVRVVHNHPSQVLELLVPLAVVALCLELEDHIQARILQMHRRFK
jgi:hypothetical protein